MMQNRIENLVFQDERIGHDEALWLFTGADIWDLGRWADYRRNSLHPPFRVTYQVDRNINYTNVCTCACSFCAFHRPPGHPEGFTLTIGEVVEKIKETLGMGGTGILLQGGCNPDIPFDYYTDLLKALRARFPTVHLHCFSPPEIIFFSKKTNQPIKKVLKELISAGLDSLPGGGAEILAEPTRKRVSPAKCTGDQWFKVMETCHRLGLKTTATMVIGLGETIDERIEHLVRLRDLQDRTSGFTAFIPWTIQPANTELEGEIESPGGLEYLRIQGVARLVLDNIPHHQVSWVTQGMELGTIALKFGADDFSSIMIEENVISSTGSTIATNENEIRKIITACGYTPVKRLTLYQDILHG